MEITLIQAKPLIMDALRAHLVPFLQSSPGIGKSSIAREIAEENQLKLIDVRLAQMDPTEISGFPTLRGEKATYLPMDMFPIEGDPIPEGYAGWLLLLDEMNSASLAVQSSAYRLILDRMVGQHPLHSRVAVMAAGNLSTDKAVVNRLSTAMQSRLIHFHIVADVREWTQWADKSGIDHRIKSFINWKPEMLHRFDPNHADVTFPCPRTWHFLSDMVNKYESLPAEKIPLMAGTIGEGAAREFFAFSKIYAELPSIDSIKQNPEGVHLPDEPSVQHALTGLIAHHLSLKNAAQLMKFLQRLNIDYQVICLRSALTKNADLRTSDVVKDWVRVNARELV